ncbi:MAG: TIR domain-containing protein [Pseudomonadales bacterium]
MRPTEEMRDLCARMKAVEEQALDPSINQPLVDLEAAVHQAAKAWSGSWIGYQAYVYYRSLQPAPAGAHFSKEWGLRDAFSTDTTGDWVEYGFDSLREAILASAGDVDLDPARALASKARLLVSESVDTVESILISQKIYEADAFVQRLLGDLKAIKTPSAANVVEAMRPRARIISRDMLALGQGFRVPPHISIESEVLSIHAAISGVAMAREVLLKLVSHLERMVERKSTEERVGTNVFIGHGRSPLWRELKDFINARLGLPWDEFNRVPVAGVPNTVRLAQMLDSAAIGFLVMTAEDEQADGTHHARMNVIHEAGLLQGRLGFERAIVLLEDGCAEFSNISGLGQIRFPRGRISACFEDVRMLLEREGIIS